MSCSPNVRCWRTSRPCKAAGLVYVAQSFFQQSMELPEFILDLHGVFTEDAPDPLTPALFCDGKITWRGTAYDPPQKRYAFSYCCLALAAGAVCAQPVLGQRCLPRGAVLAALLGRGRTRWRPTSSCSCACPAPSWSCCWGRRSRRLAICCRPFLPTPLPGRLSWAFPAGPSWPWR